MIEEILNKISTNISLDLIMDKIFQIYSFIGDSIYEFYILYSRPILDLMNFFFKNTFNLFIFITMLLATFYLFMSITVLFRKKRISKDVEKGKEPLVTIQIPTYNELAAINCAKKCINFNYPKDKMQIIIGDDSNDKSISKKINQFANKHKDLITVTRRGENIGFKPGNLNYMLKYTKGEIIVIFDSDFLPDEDFLKKIVKPFSDNKNISVVQSRWKINNFSQNIYSILGGTISLLCHNIALEFINGIKGNGFLCGSAEAIRKKDLVKVGGWLKGSLTEDIECSLRLIKEGKRLVYLEDVECECEAPFRFKDLCKQQMRWAYGVILALKIHFFDVTKSKVTRLRDKFSVVIFASGYFFSLLLLLITIFGLLSLVSEKPAPIDWPRFLSETAFNIALTSGFILSSIIALSKSKKLKELPKMIVASLSVGLAVTYYVNIGILKAIFDRKMQWFMLKKNGNECT
jgi:cellulose synthase/poly-beta-1,6-N-acetylglucosamine synthase-like glycosyltransferase